MQDKHLSLSKAHRVRQLPFAQSESVWISFTHAKRVGVVIVGHTLPKAKGVGISLVVDELMLLGGDLSALVVGSAGAVLLRDLVGIVVRGGGGGCFVLLV